MVNITQNLTTVNYSKGGKTKKYIVIHYTGNKSDTAHGNANYFKNVKRGASAHYFVDETSIYQVVKDTDTAWAVGKNYGRNNLFGTVTNANSISIEMCSTNGKIADATYKNTVELCRYLMNKHSIPVSHVYRHWDVCSKICPGWNGWGANGCDVSIWNQFKSDIANGSVSVPNTVNSTSSNLGNTSTLLKVGSRGAAVQDVQKKLVALGYNVGKSGADGIFGSGTKSAVVKFQSAHNLSQDGIVGSKTLAALNTAYENRNKSTTASSGKENVRNAQAHINNFCGAMLVVDGLYGSASKKGVVKAFQRALNLDYKAGLSEDGIRGTKTNSALGKHYVKRGEKQYLVTFVEIGLMMLGYYNGTVESPGVFGSGLANAVGNFQSANGLSNDKIAGRNTILKILECLGC